MINFKKVDKNNFDKVISMKRPDGEGFCASNMKSLAQAWIYKDIEDVHTLAICNDEEIVGFMMLASSEEEKELYIWRFMFPEEYANKGYGTKALEMIIDYAKKSKKFNKISLDYEPANIRAEHVYKKLGFEPTGEIDDGEICMELDIREDK